MDKLITTLIFLVIVMQGVWAQRIRTDHREMTPGQKAAYVDAVNAMASDIIDMANTHATNFATPIHSTGTQTGDGKQFLPWHRVHQLEMEEMLRMAGTPHAQYLTIPYWDWRIERTSQTVTWDDPGFLDLSALASSLTLSRSSLSGTIASSADVNTLIALTGPLYPSGMGQSDNSDTPTSSFFSKRLEGWHNLGHSFVGGTMMSTDSPRDPVFFLHHGFIDKLWQDWEEKDNAVQSIFDYTSLIDNYSSINPETVVDSRRTRYPETPTNILEVDVWYAYNKKLLLDGLGGTFNVTGAGKVYSYTPYNSASGVVEGVIYAGDVQRDASDNIIADSKGGFVIKANAGCTFQSGREIKMMPGFSVERGATFTARIVTTPYGFSSITGGRIAANGDITKPTGESESGASFSVYPNPSSGIVSIKIPAGKTENAQIAIYDSFGRSVYKSSPGETLKEVQEINMDTQATGLYIVHLKSGDSITRVKLQLNK